MRISIRGKALLAGVCILAGSAGWAQQSQKPVAQSKVSADLAVTFATERSQVVPGQSSFWFKGGGADAAVNFWRGLGIAASLTGDTASNLAPGVNANKLTYLGGPRYTYTAWKGNAARLTSGGCRSSRRDSSARRTASTVSIRQARRPPPAPTRLPSRPAAALNLYLTRSLGIRLIEADYVRTAMPTAPPTRRMTCAWPSALLTTSASAEQ